MGFFYDTLAVDNLLLNAIRNSADPIVFEDNVAHSYVQPGGSNDLYPPFTFGHGLFVENIGRIHPRLFSNFTAYKNYSGAWIEDSTQILRNAQIADNAVNIVNFRAVVEGTTIVGQSANVLDNANEPPVGRLGIGGGIHVMRAYGGSKSPVLRDTDGSLSGTGEPTLIMSEGSSLITLACTHMPEWQAYVCPDESAPPTAVTLTQGAAIALTGQLIGMMLVMLSAITVVHLRKPASRLG